MSTKPNKNKSAKELKTQVLRGRCEPNLKDKFAKFVSGTGLPEGHWVRVAVSEFMERKAKAA